jgi:ribose/xylose/arabinose/galactoside ABC-type transport system permease subunit
MTKQTMAAVAAGTPGPAKSGGAIARLLGRVGMLPILILVAILIFQSGNVRFLSEANVLNISQQSIYLILIALAQMLVLVSGGFDLSVGANVALTSIMSAIAMVTVQAAFPDSPQLAVWAGAGAAVGVGLFTGACNAIGVSLLAVNPFIVTLATASIFSGLTLLISNGVQVSGLPEPFVYGIGSGFMAGIPIAILLSLPVIGALYLAVNRTRYGRFLYATGSNPRAALVAGVSVNWTLAGTYIVCAVITAFAGFLLTARVSSGEPQLGAEFPLRSIAAAVIGGCSLRGGQGTVIGAVLGALFITILANGMDLLRLGSNFQMILIGLILIGAVLLERYQSASRAGGR